MKAFRSAPVGDFGRLIERQYDLSGRLYAAYEKRGLAVGDVARDIERRIRAAEETVAMLRGLRYDVSHLRSASGEKFDMERHSSQFAGRGKLGAPQR